MYYTCFTHVIYLYYTCITHLFNRRLNPTSVMPIKVVYLILFIDAGEIVNVNLY